jgi:NADPH:quinone reductase-like Zn-dependent oxidoreductase
LKQFGGYAEYAVFPAMSTFHIPDSLSFEDAATLPLAIMTAAMALFRRLPFSLDDHVQGQTVVVWGASGSVGLYAVQLAKIIGLRVIGVAGAGCAAAKAAGADVVIDYREDNPVTKIRKALNGEKLQYAIDAVSENGTTGQLAQLVSEDSNGVIVLVLYPSEELPSYISFPQTSVFCCYGKEQLFGTRIIPASAEDKDLAIRFFERLEEWLEQGKIVPNKVTVVPGGLGGVSEGFRRMREKEVSGEKIVYRIAETPGI